MDVLFSDVSEWQVPVTDDYPFQVLSIRVCDGSYRDRNFPANYKWALRALDSGRLAALIVYVVYRPDWLTTLKTVRDMVDVPHPRMAVMIDVESWQGQISGNQSVGVNGLYYGLAAWLGDARRVIGYGNTGDLDTLWPLKPPGLRLVVASYGSNPDYPGKLAHQFANDHVTPPFGPCDINSADGYDLPALCTALGIDPPANPTPTPAPPPIVRPGHRRERHDMDQLPATTPPADPDSDPATWPQTNHDVGFDRAGGWEGDYAFELGVQEWGGRSKDDARGFLSLASWITPTGLVPVDPVFTAAGGGQAIHDHAPTRAFVAPRGATGLTVNYAAPGGAYVAAGRSA